MNRFPANLPVAALLCCALTAAPAAGGTCPPGATGDCHLVHPTAGCNDPACCDAVCAIDPFCCNIDWDMQCVTAAFAICAGAPCDSCTGDVNRDGNRNGLDVQRIVNCVLNPANGSELPASPGCNCADLDLDGDVDIDDATSLALLLIENSIGGCDLQACCFSDGACLNLVANQCAALDGTALGTGSDCASDPCPRACCLTDIGCQDLTAADCATQGGLDLGPGSNCATASCPMGPCINGFGDCYAPGGNGTPGCNDPACCSIVCAADPFCCDDQEQWDNLCAERANIQCPNAPPQGCCVVPGNCQDIQGADCLAMGGTPLGAGILCGPVSCSCGDPNAGSCFVANGTPGCNDEECCQIICDNDPFCCDMEWDQSCAELAGFFCPG